MSNKHFLVLDTEFFYIKKPDFSGFLVTDFSFVVVNEKNEIVEKHGYLIKDIIKPFKRVLNHEFKHCTNFYLKNKRIYQNSIDYQSKTFRQVLKIYKDTCKKYGIQAGYAYNASADFNAILSTAEYLKVNTRFNPFTKKVISKKVCKTNTKITYEYNIYDLYPTAKNLLKSDNDYILWTKKHGFLTAKNNIKMSAESVFSYIHKKADYVEIHTGLNDAVDESKICLFLLDKGFTFTPKQVVKYEKLK